MVRFFYNFKYKKWKNLMRKFSPYLYDLCALMLVCIGTLLRIMLIYQGWPEANSDEGTMGLMAQHIAYNGEHPFVLYGQDYMGSLEAYLGAIFFHLFGPTIFSLRLGVILLYALFLLCMYFLTKSLYSKSLALVTLLLLSVAPTEVIFKQVEAVGGLPEILVLTPLLCLLTGYLVTTPRLWDESRRYTAIWRVCGFLLWAVIAGLALWSHPLIGPFIVTIGVLFLAFNDVRTRRIIIALLVLSLLMGALPFVLAKIGSAQTAGQTSLHLFQPSQQPYYVDDFGRPVPAPTFLQQVEGTLLVSLPIATGANAVCPLGARDAWPLTAQSSSHTIQCTAVHGLWGLTLIVLWIIATWQTLKYLRRNWFSSTGSTANLAERKARYRYAARLAILAGAGLTLLIYMAFPQGGVVPWSANRYLTPLQLATPAVFAPLWYVTPVSKIARPVLVPLAVFLKYGILLFAIVSLAIGAANTFGNIPVTQA